jgi:hypothetical protein
MANIFLFVTVTHASNDLKSPRESRPLSAGMSCHFGLAEVLYGDVADSLSHPGLYAWWVDETGASDLAEGLKINIMPGLIYVGQAGATRRHSGKRSDATLGERLKKNHLGNAIGSSTLRRTLAASLCEPKGLEPVHADRAAISCDSGTVLTAWMHDHLRVAIYPFDDRDNLEAFEKLVLARMDPPLNLDGMPPTPARTALGRARKVLKEASASVMIKSVRNERRSTRPHTPERITLHAEIADILRENGNAWMATTEIARLVNDRQRYRKRDGSPVTDFQIHGRTRNYSGLFEREGSRARLRQT